MTFMSNARHRLATALPMRPRPMMPTVLPARRLPMNSFFSHLPALKLAQASAMWRLTASIRPIVNSHVEMVLPSGAFITTMPCRVAVGRSTLSTPTPARAMARNLPGLESTSAVSLVSLRMQMPSYWPMIALRSSGLMPTFISTSMPGSAFRMATPSSASLSVTRILRPIVVSSCSQPGFNRRRSGGANGRDRTRPRLTGASSPGPSWPRSRRRRIRPCSPTSRASIPGRQRPPGCPTNRCSPSS